MDDSSKIEIEQSRITLTAFSELLKHKYSFSCSVTIIRSWLMQNEYILVDPEAKSAYTYVVSAKGNALGITTSDVNLYGRLVTCIYITQAIADIFNTDFVQIMRRQKVEKETRHSLISQRRLDRIPEFGERVSATGLVTYLRHEYSRKMSVSEFKRWLEKLDLLSSYIHPEFRVLLYKLTDLGRNLGITTKDERIYGSVFQTSVFLERNAVLYILDSLIKSEEHIERNKSEVSLPPVPKGNAIYSAVTNIGKVHQNYYYQTEMPATKDENIDIEDRNITESILKDYPDYDYKNENIAHEILESYLGIGAEFRDGQFEAIQRILKNERLLIVQKTGWGKSIVYFIATKILRGRGFGPTLIISPLLSLMRNQIAAASKLHLNMKTINSSNSSEHVSILQKLKSNEIDILIISPEQLANESRFKSIQESIDQLGLFVVDEAHCISDWGHDFRPDYRRIIDYVRLLPINIPVLATTATANDRVVDDVMMQLGSIDVIRGPLIRESLKIKTIKLDNAAERMAWLEHYIPKFIGSGIIYCLTVIDTQRVADYLKNAGINAVEYNASQTTVQRQEIENLFDENKVKCLVATVALGMGYDKPDISFVIHYQRPGNLVAYYQQIGRAGRNIDTAYCILLSGEEDDDIQQYFIDSAFPTENEMEQIIRCLEKSDGMNISQLSRLINMKHTRLEKSLTYLQVEKVISKDKSGMYFRTLNPWQINNQRSAMITERRMIELKQMQDFVEYDGCYMEFLAQALDDPYATSCGKCFNCDSSYGLDDEISVDKISEAQQFLKGAFIEIEPRKRWPYEINNSYVIEKNLRHEVGKTLCMYNDAGYGRMIAKDKYEFGFIRDELIDASVSLIRNWEELPKENLIICYVPSLKRPNFVRDFAYKVSGKLGLETREIIFKTETGNSQKNLNNGAHQMINADKAYYISADKDIESNILLIDDIVDSKWTLTMLTVKLKEAGALNVYPFTVANSNGKALNEKDK